MTTEDIKEDLKTKFPTEVENRQFLLIDDSIIYIDVPKGMKLTDEMIENLKNQMREVIKADKIQKA